MHTPVKTTTLCVSDTGSGSTGSSKASDPATPQRATQVRHNTQGMGKRAKLQVSVLTLGCPFSVHCQAPADAVMSPAKPPATAAASMPGLRTVVAGPMLKEAEDELTVSRAQQLRCFAIIEQLVAYPSLVC